MPETLPRAIGRYEIRRELGRGMMGVVYEAHDPALVRTIALKTIRLAFAVSEEEQKAFEERFLTEARVAARLSHPGIVVVHDVGQDGETGTLYIALEHLKGRTLAEVVAEGGPARTSSWPTPRPPAPTRSWNATAAGSSCATSAAPTGPT